jgi:hypothetical protein
MKKPDWTTGFSLGLNEETKGSRVHAFQNNADYALCGAFPEGQSRGWSDVKGEKLTCSKCFDRLWQRDPRLLAYFTRQSYESWSDAIAMVQERETQILKGKRAWTPQTDNATAVAEELKALREQLSAYVNRIDL